MLIDFRCPDCDGSMTWMDGPQPHKFEYAPDGHPRHAILTAMVDVRQCTSCGHRCIDGFQEDKIEDAVKEHLKQFETPKEDLPGFYEALTR